MPSGKDACEVQDPQSRVRALASVGSTVVVNASIPLPRYFRSGTEMLRMAKMYNDDGQLENAFILYSKYITLFVEKVPKHPDYPSSSVLDKANTKKNLQLVFPIAERIKAQLLKEYSKDYNSWLEERKRIKEEEEQERQKLLRELEEQKREQEIRKEYEKEKVWRLAQEKERLKIEASKSPAFDSLRSKTPYDLSCLAEQLDYSTVRDTSVTPSPSISSEELVSISSPERRKISTPAVDRSTKPRSLLSPGPDTEHIYGLRTVIVPKGLMNSFLKLADSNTSRNIETCGILAGKLAHNQLMITHLLVPKQTGTSDSCSTDNEEDIFSYQEKYHLITLGWIHTHPSQTAFMSSVDLHTHCSYQLMMPEAIAIVCSPCYKETGIFSLTPDYGLDYIAGCRQTGFHPHPKEPTIYEGSTHVSLEDQPVTVVDLRK